MTACVNNENGIKGGVSHKVLRSVVAGVLAVSMVPTTALAAGVDEPAGVEAGFLAIDGISQIESVTPDATNIKVCDGSTTALKFTIEAANDASSMKASLYCGTTMVGSAEELSSLSSDGNKQVVTFTDSGALKPGEYTLYIGSTGDNTDTKAYGFKILAGTPAASADANWNNSKFDYSVDANLDGTYTTTVGKLMTVDAVYYVTDLKTPLDENDYSVFYADMLSGKLVSDKVSVDRRLGGVPNEVGDYAIVVVQGRVDTAGFNTGSHASDPVDTLDELCTYVAGKDQGYHIDQFNIEKAVKEFGTVTAYEYGSTVDDGDIVYSGASTSDLGLAMDGRKAKIADFQVGDVEILSKPGKFTGTISVAADGTNAKLSSNATLLAGDYKVRLTGAGDYEGKTVDVSFTVQKLDLSDALTIASPVAKNSSITLTDRKLPDATNVKFYANGSATNLDFDNYTATLIAVNGDKSAATLDKTANLGAEGVYTFALTAKDKDNVTGETAVDVAVVSDADNAVAYKYSGAGFPTEFKPFANYSFNPANITGSAAVTDGTIVVPFQYAVYKDGQKVTSYDEPGKYLLEVWTDLTACNGVATDSYAGHKVVAFTVQGATSDLSSSELFVSYEGKEVPSNGIEYTGSAIELARTVLYKGEPLADGEDYAVSYLDADGKAVESVVEPGDYTMVVTLNDTDEHVKEFPFKVVKATIDSVEASADFFDLGTEPTFVGYTEAGLKGQKFDLASEDVSVVYYAAEWKDNLNNGKGAWDIDLSKALKASELEEGDYFADVQVKTTCKTLEGGVQNADQATANDAKDLAHVKITKKATFADVAASEWYAGPVYKAAELGYMNGYYGTAFFGPNDKITRAEAVAVIFNMAGGDASDETIDSDLADYAGKFGDVDKDAWYAQALGWAAKTGIVSGYADGNFGPNDKITREQFAAMLCNYAKKNLDFGAADKSVLDSFADAGSVSEWAAESVAWAVANKVMGNGGAIDAQSDVSRAEVAAMAVNYQPEKLK